MTNLMDDLAKDIHNYLLEISTEFEGKHLVLIPITEVVKKFGLKKSTIIKRIFNNKIIQEEIEDLPDKERMREIMEDFPENGPSPAKLVKRVSLAYRLRKRIKKGI